MSRHLELWEKLSQAYKPASEVHEAPGLYDPRRDPEIARDMAEERAAILEFDAGFSRAEAERRAFGRMKQR